MQSVYAAFGEGATWTPVGGGDAPEVMVRRETGEAIISGGESEWSIPTVILRVRRSERPDRPLEGDLVAIHLDAGGDDQFELTADGRLEPLGMEWVCEAKQII